MKRAIFCLCLCLMGCIDVGKKPIDPNQPVGPDNKPSNPTVNVLDRGAALEALAVQIETKQLTSSVRLGQIVLTLNRSGQIDSATFNAISGAMQGLQKERDLTADDAKTLRGLKG